MSSNHEMSLHPQIEKLLREMPPEARINVDLPSDAEIVMHLRRAAASRIQESILDPVDRVYAEDIQIDGPNGSIPVRLYTPHNALGALVHLHGGGWTVGSVAGDDNYCQIIARKARCHVVSVDYRLAPEHKFPIPLDDCYATWVWATKNADRFGGSDRIAIGGTSAGANLAAVVTLRARDEGGMPPALQLLVYPVCDANFDTASYQDYAEGYFLTRKAMQWFWRQYAGTYDRSNPYLSPLQAESLEGVAPALVITAENDPLRDEGEAYAARLRAAGVPVVATRYPGMIHGFITLGIMEEWSQHAIDDCVRALVQALHA